MTAPILFGKPMRPDVMEEGWRAEFGLFTVVVAPMLGGGFRAVVKHGSSRARALSQLAANGWHANAQAAATECEAWLMRTMLETAGAMGFCLRRVEP